MPAINANYYKGIPNIYFKRIIFNIIKIGNLNKSNKIILDFGCGAKVLSQILQHQKVLNYDKNPNYTEHEDYKKLYFEIAVFNHVLMYMDRQEIISTFENIKKINKDCEFIIGISKESLINKLAAFASLNFSAHEGILTNQKEQVEILRTLTKILDVKKNIFFMTDIYYARFR